jgi:hypothetical protein
VGEAQSEHWQYIKGSMICNVHVPFCTQAEVQALEVPYDEPLKEQV